MHMLRHRIGIICVAIALVVVAIALLLLQQWEGQRSDFLSDSDWKPADMIEYRGELYRIRRDVDTFLIMGVDQFSDAAPSNSYNNDRCADFLLLLVIDHATKQCSAIQINRDTMAEISVLGIGGKKVGTVTQQITLAHTYGTGEQDSCRNTARAVSGLLGGLEIDHYVCLTMDAVAVLNDLVGGVTLTVEEDLTPIHPSFVKGQTITLNSDQALLYVRHRSELEDSSNASRMKRQAQYMQALYPAVLDYISENEEFLTDVVSDLADYTTSDCSVNELEKTLDILTSYERGLVYSLDGDYSVGEYVEFYPDEDYLKQLVVELFCKPNK